MLAKKKNIEKLKAQEKNHVGTYSTRYFTEGVPKYEMPEEGMPANVAYQLIHDELNLDANPSLNLATFVTTWMEPEANKLVNESLCRNFIDHDEYPQTEIIHKRAVNMLARLFNTPEECNSIGTATIGSSEAIMLGLLAHKWTWKKRRQIEGKPFNKPNLVFGADAHICWEKFACYFDVESRIIPMEKDRYTITAEKVADCIDENTICVGAILGTTFTGQADPVEEINDLLVEVKETRGWDIPLHVDGASGGFVAPFVYPDLKWDFRLPQVKSINVSGHKFGLVYAGIGWLIFREEKDLPDDIIFNVNYLGGHMPTYTLNFSRGSSMILAQYYNFLRLGKSGYRRIMTNIIENAKYLAKKLEDTGIFEMLNPARLLPIVTVRLKDESRFTVFDLSSKLREHGWIIPAYTLPPNAQDIAALRMVVKENLSRDMIDLLFNHIMEACKELGKSKKGKVPGIDMKHRGQHIC
ncbi:MAG: glutamate decarboxylase [Candidatus Eremiobacteraeota bacterium]|nr:glutamate decarboxylase [Candidatus Eremiobacteraeota bacterium]